MEGKDLKSDFNENYISPSRSNERKEFRYGVFPWHQILLQRPFPANFKEIGRPTY